MTEPRSPGDVEMIEKDKQGQRQYIEREKINLSALLEFGWEKSRREEQTHFLTVPAPPLAWSGIYPSEDQLSQLKAQPHPANIRLSKINYKREKLNGYLSGIQFHFTDGSSTPMFQTEDAKEALEESVELDPTAKVHQIRVWFDEYPDRNVYIHGLALDGEDGQNIVGLTFANFRSRQTTEVIAEGHSIIGLQVNTKAYPDHISRLGFVVWGPCENQKLSLNDRIKIVKCNRLKDKLVTFIYFLSSLVPVFAGLYFVQKLDTALNHD